MACCDHFCTGMLEHGIAENVFATVAGNGLAMFGAGIAIFGAENGLRRRLWRELRENCMSITWEAEVFHAYFCTG